jgi:ATP-dependent RNA helicase DeaD
LKRLADANPDIFSVILSYQRDTQAVAEKLVEDGYSAAIARRFYRATMV